MTCTIWDLIKSINETKENLLEQDSENIKGYEPYVVNKTLSYHVDAIFYVNELNMHFNMNKDMQYQYYINILRKRKRYSSWVKKEKLSDLDSVKSYYSYNNEKAAQALKILTQEQLDFINKKLEIGGTTR